MVFCYYLSRYPYRFVYHLLKLIRKPRQIVFYCRELQDWDVFEPVQKYLKPVTIVSNKAHIRKHFRSLGIRVANLPVFPKAVIMARHSCYKFPSAEIIKIGMRHGPYHFKKMTRAENYNQFDKYLMTSTDDVREGQKIGITCAVAVGYPKLDPYLKGELEPGKLQEIRREAGIIEGKPTLLFSATWIGSGMSAMHKWYKDLHKLKADYNVIVTLHPWIGEEYRSVIREQGILVITGNHLPYMLLADVVIGDTSSLLAEACALDRPIITWQTESAKRSLDKIDELLRSISIRIGSWDELNSTIPRILGDLPPLAQARQKANIQMFDILDGKAGERAAIEICKLLPELEL